MDVEKILTTLVKIYCQQEGLELEEIQIEEKKPKDETA